MRKALLLLLVGLTGCHAKELAALGLDPSKDVPVYDPPASSTFVYRAGPGADRVFVSSVELTTGKLVEQAPIALSSGARPADIAITPDGRMMYVAKSDSLEIAAFALSSVDGGGQRVFEYPTLSAPLKLSMDPQGRFLFCLGAEVVVTYKIDSANGALTLMGAVAVLAEGRTMVVDRAGKYLYVSSSTSGLKTYSINPSQGKLTAVGSPIASTAQTIVVNPATGRLLGTDADNGTLLNIAANATTGLLSLTSTSPARGSTVDDDLLFDSTGSTLYAVNASDDSIEANAVDPATGALTLLNEVPLPRGCAPKSLTLVANGPFLYTACTNRSGETIGYFVNPGGSLNPHAVSSGVDGLDGSILRSVKF